MKFLDYGCDIHVLISLVVFMGLLTNIADVKVDIVSDG